MAACSSATVPTTPPIVDSAGLSNPFPESEVALIAVASEQILVAVADTADERRKGLRGVDDLGDLEGMLFIHDRVATVSYTMEDTLLPLDIWFLSAEGLIVGRSEGIPCDGSVCDSYASPEPVAYVLETIRGEFHFEIGDTVTFGG